MVNKPSIDKLTVKAGDKYTLCCVVAKRAKELAVNPAEEMEGKKPITFAAEEFDQGATVIKK